MREAQGGGAPRPLRSGLHAALFVIREKKKIIKPLRITLTFTFSVESIVALKNT